MSTSFSLSLLRSSSLLTTLEPTYRVSGFLKLWLENWYDIDVEGKPLATKMVNFIDSCIPPEERTVIKLLLVKKNFDSFRRKTSKEVIPTLPPNQIDKENVWLAETSSRDIAEQLTLLEAELFQAIKPSELIDCSWQKGNADKSAPNLLLAVSRFNQISLWVTTCIVTANRSDKQAWLLKKFITISKVTSLPTMLFLPLSFFTYLFFFFFPSSSFHSDFMTLRTGTE
jgi:hypothetical protein